MKGMLPTLHPKVLARWVALVADMYIGTKKDFSKFTCNPIESENDLSNPLRLKRVLASPGRINNVSSVYYTIGKSPPKSSARGCLRIPTCQALLTIDWSRSAAKTNRR